MQITDLGQLPYREAWALQERLNEEVRAGAEECILLVEHPPVITVGRRETGFGHLLASEQALAEAGVELVHSDRGGDITFHGPGQLVAYPIIRLADHGLTVSGYVHALEAAVIELLKEFGLSAATDPGAVGVWVGRAKICAIGVRVRRGVTMHGLALNVSTDLRYFDLIVPCGLQGRAVTSLARLMPQPPGMDEVKARLAACLRGAIDRPPLAQR